MVIFSLKTFLGIAGNWLVRLIQPVEQMSVSLAKLFLAALKRFGSFIAVKQKGKRTGFSCISFRLIVRASLRSSFVFLT
jgi:hypothetical protein